ncbi:MAG: DUF1835 domain-containing protein [Bacteroidota bacterium]
MSIQYHILNGDALKDQFPSEIAGEIMVARECLIDGPVTGESLEAFFQTRADFISREYGNYSIADYYRDTVSEFEKIQAIPEGSDIFLWFEDDLFCQVNMWFVASLLQAHSASGTSVFLLRPSVHTVYGFGGLGQAELIAIYQNRIPLEKIDRLASLWKYYQQNDTESLVQVATELSDRYPFILPAVEAHLDRIPAGNQPGRPIECLVSIMKELDTKNFGLVFKEFSKREAIYGFGDLQVKRLLKIAQNSL